MWAVSVIPLFNEGVKSRGAIDCIVIERLYAIEAQARQVDIDDVVESSESFRRFSPVFEDLVGEGIENAEVEYFESDGGGIQKQYRFIGDDLCYQLVCRFHPETPREEVSCEISVFEE